MVDPNPPDRTRLQRVLLDLTEVMHRLRRECPWDRKQTHASLRRYLLEEVYEVLEALDDGDQAELRAELGDLMFQIWFHAELASEDDDGFDLADVVEGIRDKLVRRHPHVFADAVAEDAEAVKRNWDDLKREEKSERESALDGTPRELPALLRSRALQEKAAAVGFDWPDRAGVAAKVREEVEEVLAEVPDDVDPKDLSREQKARVEAELGDLMMALVNWGRHVGVDAEDGLRAASKRFERRFRRVEVSARSSGRALQEMRLDELNELWDAAKRAEAERE